MARERLARIQEAAQEIGGAVRERLGYEFVPRERMELLEARSRESGALRRELDSLAYTALNYGGGRRQDLKVEERMMLVQKSRVVWMKDPQAGAGVDLMNDFTIGRGLTKPTARDEKVQEVIDEAWDDADNQETLTSYQAQVEMNTDLSLQANWYLQVFDDGDDGKVKLSTLDHDTVVGAVHDKKEKRKRVLYYMAREPEDMDSDWDFATDTPMIPVRRNRIQNQNDAVYYEHWRNVDRVREDLATGARPAADAPNFCPDEKLGIGKIYHVALNKGSEMTFGHPQFDRLLGWYNAYNRFMDARVDIMEASAAFVMKRKVQGTPNQLQKQATQALSRRSALGMGRVDPVTGEELTPGPRPGSILNENEGVTYEDFKIDTQSQSAQADAQMLRSQISAATRFPQSYYGDASQSNLATATSLELPVLKAVESRQEIVEGIVRFFIDRVIERAVEVGTIAEELDQDEIAQKELSKPSDPLQDQMAAGMNGALAPGMNGQVNGQVPSELAGDDEEFGPGSAKPKPPLQLTAAHEDAVKDEIDTKRDLSYEFSMPNPLKRMLTDFVTAIQNIATTFDPNNTNTELSRVLLEQALNELEIEDAASVVDRVFPDDYADPAVMAAQQAQFMGMNPPFPPGDEEDDRDFDEEFGGSTGADGQKHPARNAYGAPGLSMQQAVEMGLWPRDRTGGALNPRALMEARRKLPPSVAKAAGAHRRQTEDAFDAVFGTNGHSTPTNGAS